MFDLKYVRRGNIGPNFVVTVDPVLVRKAKKRAMSMEDDGSFGAAHSTGLGPYSPLEVSRLQRTIGNSQTAVLLQREAAKQKAKPVIKELTEEEKTAAEAYDANAQKILANVPATVLSWNGGQQKGGINTPARRRNLLEAGTAYFGSPEATATHFAAIGPVAVPGNPMMHASAKARLESVRAAVKQSTPGAPNEDGSPGPVQPGMDIPSSNQAFAFRHNYDEPMTFKGDSMHELGFAIDYDAYNLPRIGKGESAELIRIVTGAAIGDKLGEYGQRRGTITKIGKQTEKDPDAILNAQESAFLSKIPVVAREMSAMSLTFQNSLGPNKAALLDLRTSYINACDELLQAGYDKVNAGKNADKLQAAAERKAAAETSIAEARIKLPPLIAPWTNAVSSAEKGLKDTLQSSAAAGVNPASPPTKDQVVAMINGLETTLSSTKQIRQRIKGAEVAPDSPDDKKIKKLEAKYLLASEGTALERLQRIDDLVSLRKPLLQAILGVAERLARIKKLQDGFIDLKAVLGEPDPSPRKKGSAPKVLDQVNSPPLAQLADKGFFRTQTVGEKFLVELAKHGFDMGLAWGGETVDSMHMELVVGAGGAIG
jgi:hypothetical protein